MRRIAVTYPTRGRAPASMHALARAIERLSGKHRVDIFVGLDPDDPTLIEAQSALKGVHEAAYKNGARVDVLVGESHSKIHAANRLVPSLDSFDVLIGHSDDMEIIADGWDDIVVSALMERFPDSDGYVQVHDGRRGDIATWPVCGAEFLRSLPYNNDWFMRFLGVGPELWNSAYRTICPDDELHDIAWMRNRRAYLGEAPGSLVLHRHPAWGNRPADETDRKWSAHEERDRAILAERREKKFDLKRPILTVLTPTMREPMERAAWVDRVRSVIGDARRILRGRGPQLGELCHHIEWIVAKFEHQDHGGPTIGEVRRNMVRAAMGAYAMFLDDDDTLLRGGMDLAAIVHAIVEHDRRTGAMPDVVSFDVAHRCDPGEKWRMSRHEVGRPWRDRIFAHDSTIYAWERPPNHINPFRTEILRQFPFDPQKRYAEDRDLAERIAAAGVVLSSVHLKDVVYVYETPRADATRKWTS